jgi:hypothetical protein
VQMLLSLERTLSLQRQFKELANIREAGFEVSFQKVLCISAVLPTLTITLRIYSLDKQITCSYMLNFLNDSLCSL